jgi:hypothetical protein
VNVYLMRLLKNLIQSFALNHLYWTIFDFYIQLLP